jgi:hypothetical protein
VPPITFGWTTPALIVGAQTCTRRSWSPRHARGFHGGDVVCAYNREPRTGGRQMATIRLMGDPALEPLRAMPDEDYGTQGWKWLYDHFHLLPPSYSNGGTIAQQDFSWAAFERWRERAESLWVVRFELLDSVALQAQRVREKASQLVQESDLAREQARALRETSRGVLSAVGRVRRRT